MVMIIWSLAAPHGPAGSSDVSVSVTLRAVISAAVGVYVALSVLFLGANVPAPPLHMPLLAPPPTAPASWTCGLLAQTRWSPPALAVAAGWMVTCIASADAPHGPAGSL